MKPRSITRPIGFVRNLNVADSSELIPESIIRHLGASIDAPNVGKTTWTICTRDRMLKIENLHASVTDSDEIILKGIDLEVNPGEGACHHGAQRQW